MAMTTRPGTAERLLVLDPEVPEAAVEAACAELSSKGWRCEASRGEEQVILLLSGSGDPAAVHQVRSGAEVHTVGNAGQLLRERATRRFMSAMVAALGLLTAGAILLPVLGYLRPPARPFAERDVLAAGRAADIPVGAARQLWFRGRPVALVHLAGTGFRAVDARCTYAAECKLAWDSERRQLLCPCHGCAFDVHGNVQQGPASIPLARFAVEQIDERLFVRQEGT